MGVDSLKGHGLSGQCGTDWGTVASQMIITISVDLSADSMLTEKHQSSYTYDAQLEKTQAGS